MAKMYEALENAGQSRGGGVGLSPAMPAGLRISKPLENKLLAVARRVLAARQREDSVVVQFASTQDGEDSSRIATAFAKLIPLRLGRQTLLLTAGPRPASRKLLPGSGARGWDAVLTGEAQVEDTIYSTEIPGLSVGEISAHASSLPTVLASPKARQILEQLRSRFDIIVIDTPPVNASWDAISLASMTDGAVLVVEAGRTRWQAVKAAVDNIEEQQGRVFGVVLNKQRHYIPAWIYRRFL
jgi:capsular exopolysaccharide synthesis family protein